MSAYSMFSHLTDSDRRRIAQARLQQARDCLQQGVQRLVGVSRSPGQQVLAADAHQQPASQQHPLTATPFHAPTCKPLQALACHDLWVKKLLSPRGDGDESWTFVCKIRGKEEKQDSRLGSGHSGTGKNSLKTPEIL
jgi:hypothetical protein